MADGTKSGTKVAIVPGDGVGPEVMAEAVKLLETLDNVYHLNIEIVTFDLSGSHFLETGLALPEGVVSEISDGYKGILLGPLGDPRIQNRQYPGEILWGLVRALDLFVVLREIKLLFSSLCPLSSVTEGDLDVVLVSEGRTGAHPDIGGSFEKETEDEIVIEQVIVMRRNVERSIRFAFDYAKHDGRARVTMVYDSKSFPHGHDLWVRTFLQVSEDYPDIASSRLQPGSLVQQLVNSPDQLDVVVTGYSFGSIVSGLGAALQGGQGLASGAYLHPGKMGLFRPLHPSSPKYAGKDYANPMATMLCVQQLMDYLGHSKAAVAIETALRKAVESGWVTRDLDGSMGTSEVGDYVCSFLMENIS